VAIHTKLLEIYAKRRDAKAFEQMASEAYGITRGEGPEWARICELGQDLDPTNPMYQPGGQPSGAAPLAPAAAAAATGATVASAAAADPFTATSAQPAVEEPPPSVIDLDLDLDFSAGDEPAATAPAPIVSASAAAPAASLDAPLEMDFGALEPLPAATQPARLETPAPADDDSLSFDAPLDLTASAAPAPAKAAPAPAAGDSGMLEFDLGGLSLDLDSPPESAVAAPADEPVSTAGLELPAVGDDDPLATKLALAQEFNAIGDADGARSLAQEVIAEASGDLKSKAQKFLAEIG
jgi:pilus assembly protein FimV